MKVKGTKTVKEKACAVKKEKGKPGRPNFLSQIAVGKEGQKPIKAFFSPPSSGVKVGENEPSILEFKLMHVDGMSRTAARHMAQALKASLGSLET